MYINMTDEEYQEWAESFQNYSFTDMLDTLYDRLCEIERLKKKLDEVVKNHQDSIEYQSKLDNEREYYESIDRYPELDGGIGHKY